MTFRKKRVWLCGAGPLLTARVIHLLLQVMESRSFYWALTSAVFYWKHPLFNIKTQKVETWPAFRSIFKLWPGPARLLEQYYTHPWPQRLKPPTSFVLSAEGKRRSAGRFHTHTLTFEPRWPAHRSFFGSRPGMSRQSLLKYTHTHTQWLLCLIRHTVMPGGFLSVCVYVCVCG